MFYWTQETSTNRVSSNTGPTSGFWSLSRTNSTQFSVYRNSGLLASASSGGGFPSLNFYLSATNDTGVASSRSNSLLSFSALHTGLTSAESQLLYRIIEKFQVALGRNINTVLPFYYNSDYSIEVNNFIFNAGITNATQQSALNTLVNTLKTANIWTKMKAVYPMVGGNATSHRYNLVNTSNYLLTFNGGWTHSASGATPNGTTAYANTSLNPYGVLNANSLHMSYYGSTDVSNSITSYKDFMGAVAYGPLRLSHYSPSVGNVRILGEIGQVSNPTILANTTNKLSLVMLNRQTSTLFKVHKRGVTIGTNTSNAPIYLPNTYAGGTYYIYLGSTHRVVLTEMTYSNLQCSFSSIGDGLTDDEALTFYNAVQAFQTTLGRQV
jgi:hypothetical protein